MTSPLDHDLTPCFPDLARYGSGRELERSELFRELRPRIDRVLECVVTGSFAEGSPPGSPPVRAAAWNIERGTRLEGILRILKEHPVIRSSQLLLLTELDYGMARSANRFVAREIARKLGMHYAFAPCYLALQKGSGLEAETPGENARGVHGNALFSRHPIREAHSVALPNGKDLMRGKEKRLGCQRAVVATIQHPAGDFRAVSLHLDAHSTQRHRHRQMKIILDHLESLDPLPTLVGGDWNTSTHNSKRAAWSILGYCRRVLMGVHYVLENHYPYPERYFEKHLFRELERRGYDYRGLNLPGACTLHYNIRDLAATHRMADWIPGWCFWFINWALEKNNGWCAMKLDWFAGKGIRPAGAGATQVCSDVHTASDLLSDHDPIVLDFEF